MIYTTGTVSTVSGSAIVSGTGTKWTVNNPAIRSGTIILIKNGNANFIYMVDRVNSDTELVISQPATFTVKNTSYSINLTEPNSYSDANNRMTAIASDTTYFLRAMDQWMMNNGVVTVELSNGQKVTLDSIKKMQGDIANKLSKGDYGFGTRVTFDGGSLFLNGVSDWTGLRLIKSTGDAALIQTDNQSGNIFNIDYLDGEKTRVARIAVPKASGTMMLVGDYGIGSVNPRFTNDDLTNTQHTSFFLQTGGSESKLFKDHGCGIHLAYNSKIKTGLFVNALSGVTYSYYSDARVSDGVTKVREIYSKANTTVDSNGFIKKASPIIDINPDGTFTTNDESKGSTVTRVAKGEYLIEGVLGFNSDAGWGGVDGGIEIPLDVNKQPLIWVDSEVMEDGSILVKTYHRTHPNAPKFARNDIDDYKDGDPIDIPDGRFISVRVQMPEQSIYNVRMREMEEAQKAEEE
ncbi:hypothetical protein PWG11_12020 [Proteus mirabilis]|uniref:phage tail fiber protein n=1 Tax=Proteus mirabilis TaxID=584 RepID=UPI0038F5E952